MTRVGERLGGPELWASIVARAGIDLQVLVAMEPYDDALTYRLVEAASTALGISEDEVLEAFGEHWILYTGLQGYGAMLSMMGTTLEQLLADLDSMHSRVALNMPDLRPPAFACEVAGEGHILLRYWSQREGLAPMVAGLLKGLGRRFDLDLTVALAPRGAGEDHQTFLVTYAAEARSVTERP